MSPQNKASYGASDQNTRGVSGKFLVIGIVGVLIVLAFFGVRAALRRSTEGARMP